MTAVLSATDALRSPLMASVDDNQINYSSTDWKTKYYEVADMLAETRAELDEFHTSSKELEEELIKEIERTEKAQQDLKVKISRVESDRDEWKSKFMSLQTTHNTTTTSLQRELDTLRQECQKLKVQLRELEMGNDDLERNERAVSSSLADIEAKYSRALEEKILLEHELLDKAHLEEECQRLKDELRDAGVEISILQDQLAALQSKVSAPATESPASAAPSTSPQITPSSTEENLLHTPPPPDLQLAELSAPGKSLSTRSHPSSVSSGSTSGHPIALPRALFQTNRINTAHSTPPPITRSSTLPAVPAPRNPFRPPIPRPNFPSPSTPVAQAASAIPMVATKSRGVQMVSEMRARVKNLEQKIHTRVPRLRMGSSAGRQGANALALPTVMTASPASASSGPKTAAFRTAALDSKLNKPTPKRYSADIDTKKSEATTPDPNASGWVLIMDDTPSPIKNLEKERRRVSSPSGPSAYRTGLPKASSPTFSKPNPLAQSTARRPQSRLSGASMSTIATVSSIPTPSSRPTTPTFLPLPISSLYSNSHTPGNTLLKRSAGPGIVSYALPKRSSLGSGTPSSPTPSSDSEAMGREQPAPYNAKTDHHVETELTSRGSSRIPSSVNSSVLSQSRIGRPAGVVNGRKNFGLQPPGEDSGAYLATNGNKKSRGRSGSSTFGLGR
ncbi:hypothetical protein F5J12DRAFT_743387 [Pisolithus orientalis]|uniref:uncharacterized protein n=1 Tax=Pisolithus orientalis TaxID=936130 RepID=UPI002224F830|nr:uncharacterized protein F5J12DRAFT_743387 [Pisolithus orientalis]KAI6005267.1 hypothetical protein F5J12DRAFT_743387 [Pisolithus orientalis]